MLHYRYHGENRTHGGPQVAAACFAAIIPVVFLLPMVRIGFGGSGNGRGIMGLIGADAGAFNIFALVLVLLPFVGIAVEMMGRPSWDLTALVLSLIGLVCVPLMVVWAAAGAHALHGPLGSVTPLFGAYTLFIAYLVLAAASAYEAFRFRRRHAATRDRDAERPIVA